MMAMRRSVSYSRLVNPHSSPITTKSIHSVFTLDSAFDNTKN